AVGTPESQRTSMAYDAAGNLTLLTRFAGFLNAVQPPSSAPGFNPVVSIVTRYQYDYLNQRTAVIEAVGHPAQRETDTPYDAAGAVALVTTALAPAATKTTGPPTDSAKPVTTAYTYDALGRRTATFLGWTLSGPAAQPVQALVGLAASAGFGPLTAAVTQS